MNYLFGQIARCVPSSLALASPTDKSEIPIWFPQSNVTKSNVTKPLLQIGFLTHWKEGSGILVRHDGRDRRTFNIQTILVASQKRRADSSTKSSDHFREYVRKIFPGEYGGRIFFPSKKLETQRHRTGEVEMAKSQMLYHFLKFMLALFLLKRTFEIICKIYWFYNGVTWKSCLFLANEITATHISQRNIMQLLWTYTRVPTHLCFPPKTISK